jgi:hypothetical protein
VLDVSSSLKLRVISGARPLQSDRDRDRGATCRARLLGTAGLPCHAPPQLNLEHVCVFMVFTKKMMLA